ncbi:BatD family protein [Reinekea sp.]|uniref:BatD family protein n=3 Tax=Reinekea sp. TaxID=1970455 RepID=UPI0039897907
MGKQALLLILLIFTASLGFAQVTARADRLEIYDDETFILTVSVSPSTQLSRADISALESIFTIISRGQSSQSSSVNGQRTSVTEYQFRLAPKEFGLLGLPVFTVNNEQSDAFFINVKDSKSRTNNLDPDAIRYSIDVSNKSPYVDQTISLTIEIAYRIALTGQFSNYSFPGFEKGTDTEQQSVETRQGKSYNVYKRTITLTPRQAGEFSLPDIAFLGQYQVSSARPAQRINLNAKPPKITVKPIPAEYPAGAYWLPAENLEVEDNLSQKISLEENEHLSWSITQTVTGLSANLLPDPLAAIENNATFQLYRDNPIFKNVENEGTRKDITALSAKTNAGPTLTLPKVSIPWWNIETDQLEYATLPSRNITITASTSRPSQTESSTNETNQPVVASQPSSIWQWVSLVLAVFLAVSLTVTLFLLKRIQNPKQAHRKPQAILNKIKLSSVDDAYPALIKLAQQHQSSIAEIKSALPEETMQYLNSIEAQYYSGDSKVECSLANAQLVVDCVQKIIVQSKQTQDKAKLSIYPSG